MQWTGDMNAGFSNVTNATWLPVHPDYSSVNVEVLTLLTATILEIIVFILHLASL